MIGYRRSSNKLIVSTSWLSMCYSSKSSAGTWLLHFNSLLAKLTIYYSMCWLRSEKMNWLLIRVALRGHRGETTHSLAISVNGGPFLTGTARAGLGHWVSSLKSLNLEEDAASNMATILLSQTKDNRVYRQQLQFHLMILVTSVDRTVAMRGRLFGSKRFLNKSLTSEGLWIGKLWRKYLTGKDDLWGNIIVWLTFLVQPLN